MSTARRKVKIDMPPTYEIGNLRDHFDDRQALLLCTANGVINQHGALVMGAGFARTMRDAFIGLDYQLGQAIIARGCFRSGSVHTYYLEICPQWSGRLLGALQVQYHFRWPASVGLIETSVARLKIWCEIHPDVTVRMNYPGTDWAPKSRNVEPLLAILPPQVHIFKLESEREVEP